MSKNNNKQEALQSGAPRRGGHGGPPGGPGSMAVGEKSKNFKQAWKDIIGFIGPYKAPIIIAMLLAVISTVISIIGPSVIMDITEYIEAGLTAPMQWDKIIQLVIIMACAYLAGAVFNYVQGFIMATTTQLISKRMRTDISKKINRLPLNYFDTTSYGDVLSRVTNDVDTVGQSLNNSIITLITSVLMLLGVTVMMFVTNWIMAFTAIGASIIGFAIMMVIMSRSQKYFIAQQRYLGQINGHIEEVYSGLNVVKAYNAGGAAKATFDGINKNLRKSADKSQFMSASMMPLMGFVGNFGYVAVCVVGAVLAVSGTAGLGLPAIVAFMIYVRLFTNPLSQLAQIGSSLQSAAAAGERVAEFLAEKEMDTEEHKTVTLDTVKGDVEFEHVKFGYDPEKIIIKDFSAKVKAGSKVAIVGPTGAGKTTLVNLLMRFYEVNSGSILIDGIDIRDLTRANIHDIFGMVLQDTWMFEGTIKENIMYSKTDAPEEKIVEACKAANLDHFIRTLPHGYDTVMDDKANLSSGQKQLVTIARAMVEDAPMLILDEATSSVDTRTEVLIQEAMDRLTAGRTSFVIAHRLSTIKNSDMILVLKDGDIIENGNHEELMAKQGFYCELYNSQFTEA